MYQSTLPIQLAAAIQLAAEPVFVPPDAPRDPANSLIRRTVRYQPTRTITLWSLSTNTDVPENSHPPLAEKNTRGLSPLAGGPGPPTVFRSLRAPTGLRSGNYQPNQARSPDSPEHSRPFSDSERQKDGLDLTIPTDIPIVSASGLRAKG